MTIGLRKSLATLALGGALLLATAWPASAQTTIAPLNVTISVNGRAEPQVVQGEPMIVDVVLANAAVFSPAATALQVNALNGSWANTVKLSATDASGNTLPWTMQLTNPASGALILDGEQIGVLHYLLTATASKNLAPATYYLLATIDTTSSAGTTGWKGTASGAAMVQVISSSAATPDELENQTLSQALADHLQGNDTQAIADVNKLLAEDPSSVSALKLKATLLTNSGDKAGALDATQKAIAAIYAESPAPQEPPSALWHAATQLREAVYNNGAQQAAITTVIASSPATTYNAAAHSITPSATISSASGSVSGGTVTFTVTGVGLSVTSGAVAQGKASATFTIPAGTHAGVYPLDASYSGNSNFEPSADPKENLTIQKAKPAIEWVNPADITQGTALSATQLDAAASTPGIFSYTPAAGTVLPVGASQRLAATFTPADATDYSVTSASVLINVKAASGLPLTITATNVSRRYGQPNPAFAVTYKGFASGDTPAVLSGTLNCISGATTASPVGAYSITCSGLTSTKYSIQFVPGRLSVITAPLTITAKNSTRPFGQANPAFTATFSAFSNGDTPSSLSGALTCTSPATAASSVAGSPYQITCSGVTSSNYAITFAPGSLTVTKSTAVITWANPASITQGTALGPLQLNATANAPGTFTYVPPAGTVLGLGSAQILSVTFAPTDNADYNSAAATVTINVNAPLPGDLNGDGLVNCGDLNVVKASFGKKAGQAGFDPRADLNHDGIVNVIDLSAESKFMPAGTTCQ